MFTEERRTGNTLNEKQFWKPGNMVYPLPAVMVSCAEEGKTPNIITVAWTGTICTNPAMVYISVKPERYSYELIKNSGEFVINLTTKNLVKAVDFCGVRSGRDLDKFKEMNLTPVKGNKVHHAPLIGECPVNIECRVREIVQLGSHHMFMADVLGVNIDSRYMNENGKFQLNQSDLIIYSHGEYYGFGDLLGSFGYSVRKPSKKKQGKKIRKIEEVRKNE
jgi:flavin reductase (DIM6/NTAB) family NADH-FMN oxidoreductase RutF